MDPYAGAVLVYSDPVNTGWDMVVYGISQRACEDVALDGQLMGSNLVQIVIGTNAANPSTGGTGSYGLTQSAWATAVVGACVPGTNIRFSMAS